jgi:hypothetical protein
VAAGGDVQEAGAREGGGDGRHVLGRDVLRREAAMGSTRLGGRRRPEFGGCFAEAMKMMISHRRQKETSVKIASILSTSEIGSFDSSYQIIFDGSTYNPSQTGLRADGGGKIDRPRSQGLDLQPFRCDALAGAKQLEMVHGRKSRAGS